MHRTVNQVLHEYVDVKQEDVKIKYIEVKQEDEMEMKQEELIIENEYDDAANDVEDRDGTFSEKSNKLGSTQKDVEKVKQEENVKIEFVEVKQERYEYDETCDDPCNESHDENDDEDQDETSQKKPHTCSICRKAFSKPYKLKLHMRYLYNFIS